jgi:dTDP-glucose pyrophosphorylase
MEHKMNKKNMLNIVVPMAGAGSRFKVMGYSDPKPLIYVRGKPMIKLVIDNLMPNINHRFIFISQSEHVNKYGLREKMAEWSKNSVLIEIDGVTDGAACTVLAAKDLINNDCPLMIANSDQYIDADINAYLNHLDVTDLDGLIMTMGADDPKWSFVEVSNDGYVVRVVEKEVISNEATVGIYSFKTGASFINAAESMIAKNDRVNGEFYVAPVYNQLISNAQKIGIYNIGREGAGMHGLGTPNDLSIFLSNPISSKI